MSHPDVVIHVGYRKTATTWLQEMVFRNHQDINYLGKTDDNYPPWLINLHYLDDYAYERERPRIHEEISARLSRDRLNLISSEAFTNTGVIYSQALRLCGVLPHARILVTLRDPLDMLVSHYKDDVEDGLCILDLEYYLDWKRTPYVLIKRKPVYLPDFLFDETLGIYNRIFGARNVCVLKYEDMVNTPEAYFRTLESFMGVSFSKAGYKLTVKVHAGLNEDRLKDFKVKHAMEFLKKYFPVAARKISYEDLAADVHEQILSNALRQKLINYFQGKCYGYY